MLPAAQMVAALRAFGYPCHLLPSTVDAEAVVVILQSHPRSDPGPSIWTLVVDAVGAEVGRWSDGTGLLKLAEFPSALEVLEWLQNFGFERVRGVAAPVMSLESGLIVGRPENF
jgi:hypothetical protein